MRVNKRKHNYVDEQQRKHYHVDEQKKTQACGRIRENTFMWMNKRKFNPMDEHERTHSLR